MAVTDAIRTITNSQPARQLQNAARRCWSHMAARYHYHRLLRGADCRTAIRIVSIEFCSVCNLRCRYCDLRQNDRPAFLDVDLYAKLMDELSEPDAYHLETLEWPISGAFFLHPQYTDILQLTRAAIDRNPRFRPWIILNDNMMLFTPDRIEQVLATGVINQIICSIDGRDAPSLERMRPRARWDRVLAHTEQLVDANQRAGHPLIIEINNGIDHACRHTPRDPRLQTLFDRVDHVRYWEPTDWNESFHGDTPAFAPARSFCTFVLNSATLSTAGTIIKCCMDLQERTAYGNFRTHTLNEIWHSPQRRRDLGLMARNQRNQLPFCATCSIGLIDNCNRYDQRRPATPTENSP